MMKKCIICGKEHEGGCDKSGWDSVLANKFGIIEEVKRIEDGALKQEERQHVAKRRGRKPKNA